MKTIVKTIVINSGGLDSVTLAHKVAAENELLGFVFRLPGLEYAYDLSGLG